MPGPIISNPISKKNTTNLKKVGGKRKKKKGKGKKERVVRSLVDA